MFVILSKLFKYSCLWSYFFGSGSKSQLQADPPQPSEHHTLQRHSTSITPPGAQFAGIESQGLFKVVFPFNSIALIFTLNKKQQNITIIEEKALILIVYLQN
jgi:hypothetical protein